MAPRSRKKPSARGRGSRRSRALRLVGLDVGHGRLRTRSVLPPMLGVLVVALGFAALRIDLLRIRYALGEAMKQEQLLLDEQRSLTAQMRALRDPVELASRARELGFARPDRLIDLPEPGARPASAAETVLAEAKTDIATTHLGQP